VTSVVNLDRVLDLVLDHDLAAAQQAWEDRQPGGVGRRPAVRAQVVAGEAPHRAGPGVPAAVAAPGVERLVQLAAAPVDEDRVPVPVGSPATLDPGVAAQRVAHLVALAGVVESHRHLAVAAADDGDRDPVRRRLGAEAGAEVRVQLGYR